MDIEKTEQLLGRYQQGDKSSINELFAIHMRRLKRLISHSSQSTGSRAGGRVGYSAKFNVACVETP